MKTLITLILILICLGLNAQPGEYYIHSDGNKYLYPEFGSYGHSADLEIGKNSMTYKNMKTSNYYLETGIFYSKTLKEWINIDDILAITDIKLAPEIQTGTYSGPPPEWWSYAGQYYFHIKYKRGKDYIVYQPEESEIIRLHNDFVSIWQNYKKHHKSIN